MPTQILITILLIPFIHWIADFVCQTDYQAINKSKEWNSLLNHTIIYSLIWAGVIILTNAISVLVTDEGYFYTKMCWFPVITFACHTATDYYTSRVNSSLIPKRILHPIDKEYSKQEDMLDSFHGFFVSVGFDQFLHYSQLFITYYLLIK